MLSMFVIKRTFNKLDVKLWVDCETKDATLTVKYDGLLRQSHKTIPYADVDSPQKAEAYMSKPIPVQGGVQPMIEWMEAMYKREAAAAA